MPNKQNRKTLAGSFVNNNVKMQKPGLDDPIDWDAFSTPIQRDPKQTFLQSLVSPNITSAAAGNNESTKKSAMPEWLVKLLMLGYKQ